MSYLGQIDWDDFDEERLPIVGGLVVIAVLDAVALGITQTTIGRYPTVKASGAAVATQITPMSIVLFIAVMGAFLFWILGLPYILLYHFPRFTLIVYFTTPLVLLYLDQRYNTGFPLLSIPLQSLMFAPAAEIFLLAAPFVVRCALSP